jgi:hypothetical protein
MKLYLHDRINSHVKIILWVQYGLMSRNIQCCVMLLTFVLLYIILTVLSFLLKYCIFPNCKLNLCFILQGTSIQNVFNFMQCRVTEILCDN